MPLIQIIDDDVILLASIGFLLEEAGFDVHKSSDLTHAEQSYDEERPDLVLLEVRSERDRGWDLLARIGTTTPVIVVSAASREEDVVRGFAAGAVDYIPKPYRSVELITRVRARLVAPPERPSPKRVGQTPPKVGPTERRADTSTPPKPVAGQRRDDDEQVFMSEAEEMALLRMLPAQPATPPAEPAVMEGDERLGRRLRNERVRRHLTLVQVENELKIRMSYLQAIEDEKYTLLPRGPVALQMLSSYVSFLGIDPEPIVADFRNQHYVEQSELPPGLGGAPIQAGMPTWIIWIVAIVLAVAVAIGAIGYFDPGFFQNLWAQIAGLMPHNP
ncbi:MAG: response regulator [Oscillochloris sp.]|nr:response regulator [Oscillochloris sp.]